MILFKSNFSCHMNDMISFKKALGYSEASYKIYLCDFDNYCTEHFPKETELTKVLVMDWCRKRDSESINTLNRRLAAIREFSRYLLSVGVAAYVMPPKMTASQTRYIPHIFTDYELSSFFHSTDNMGKALDDPLRHYIIPVIFRLIYCCGLRPNEGLLIKSEDINLESGRLFIRKSKRHKDRVVMLSADVLQLCRAYVQLRNRLCIFSEYFFPDRFGRAHNKQWLSYHFRKCWDISGLGAFRPRIYDFRHTFATRCLHNWMDEKIDLHKMLPYLSSYMGHSHFSVTVEITGLFSVAIISWRDRGITNEKT